MTQLPAKIYDENDIARASCLSVSQISSLFRKHFNSPPMKYFTKMKMDAAKSLLTTQDISVKQAAFFLGYEDQFTFSKTFKRTVGLSPKKFQGEFGVGKRKKR